MTAASVGQKVVSFIFFTLIARHLGAELTGKYFFALSFSTIFVVFVDLGLTNVLVREGARLKEKIQSYFSTILSVKLVLGILAYAAAALVINLMDYPIEIKRLVYLSAVTMLFDSLHLTLYGILRAVGDLKYEAASIVGSQILTFTLGSVFLYLNFPLIFLILAFTIPSFLNVCFAALVLFQKYRIALTPRYEADTFKYLSRVAIPFALAAVCARIYSYIDSVLLSKLIGDTAVGWYSISYKITYAFQFVPLALVAALYPRFSDYFTRDKERLAYLFQQAMKYLLIIVFPIAVGIGVLARDIVLALYTSGYSNSILPLQILLIGLVFSYVSFPIGAFLNACNRQAAQTAIVVSVMILNIVLNLLLIPRLGVVGAAVAALVGNVCLTVSGYVIVPRLAKISHRFLFRTLCQLIVATAVMGVTVWYVNLMSHFTVAILAGAVVYPLMLLATRTVTRQQLQEAIRLVRR